MSRIEDIKDKILRFIDTESSSISTSEYKELLEGLGNEITVRLDCVVIDLNNMVED